MATDVANKLAHQGLSGDATLSLKTDLQAYTTPLIRIMKAAVEVNADSPAIANE
jgi:hypothetical protein